MHRARRISEEPWPHGGGGEEHSCGPSGSYVGVVVWPWRVRLGRKAAGWAPTVAGPAAGFARSRSSAEGGLLGDFSVHNREVAHKPLAGS